MIDVPPNGGKNLFFLVILGGAKDLLFLLIITQGRIPFFKSGDVSPDFSGSTWQVLL